MGFLLAKLNFKGHFDEWSHSYLFSSLVFLFGVVLACYGDFYRAKVEGISTIYDIARILGVLLIFYGTFSGGLGKSVFRLKWVVIIGGMCYTIYLIHLFVFQVATKVIANFILEDSFLSNMFIYGFISIILLAISTLVFYVFVEKPFMDLSSKFKGKKP